jgi:phospholipid-binding lipoprotein MlaA
MMEQAMEHISGSVVPLKKSKTISAGMWLLLCCLIGGCATNNNHDLDEESNASSVISPVPDTAAGDDDFEPTVVAFRDYRDPLIGFNRAMFAFNDVSYRYVLVPLGKGYTNTVPDSVQRGIGNFFYNIKAPIYFVNNLLQLKPRAAGTNVVRFGINSTIGLLGFFDPASHWFGIEKKDTHLADTLAKYGAGYGFYMVLPLLGPSDLRSGTSVLVEGFLHPVSYIASDRDRILIQGFDYFQEFAPEAEGYPVLIEESDDPYIFMRNLYLQSIQRDAEYIRRPAAADND